MLIAMKQTKQRQSRWQETNSFWSPSKRECDDGEKGDKDCNETDESKDCSDGKMHTYFGAKKKGECDGGGQLSVDKQDEVQQVGVGGERIL